LRTPLPQNKYSQPKKILLAQKKNNNNDKKTLRRELLRSRKLINTIAIHVRRDFLKTEGKNNHEILFCVVSYRLIK